MSRMACVIALAAGVGLGAGLGTTEIVHAAPMPAAFSGLQITVTSTGAPSRANDGSVSLEVTFKGGNLKAVELHLDGFLIKKQSVKTREGRGVITFALDGLTDGFHDVMVKAIGTDGSTATTTTTLTAGPSTAEPLGDTGTHFEGLRPNQMVQGIIPVQLEVEKAIRAPYVTYLVDNEFLAFMNYAPFTYNWDTTRMTNGTHTLGIEIYDGESLNKVRTLTMQVTVNNPGGFTKIKRDAQPLTLPQAGPESTLPGLGLSASEDSTPLRASRAPLSENFEARTSAPSLARRDQSEIKLGPSARSTGALLSEPAEGTLDTGLSGVVRSLPVRVHPSAATSASLAAPDETALPTDLAGRVAGLRTAGTLAALAAPSEFEASELTQSGVARLPLHLKRNGNVATLPSFSLRGGTVSAISAAPGTPAKTPAPKLRARMSLRAMSALKGGFAVSFDNKEVNFDVTPRVEKGIPLAPFRQIFETSGGEVAFYNKTKTIRAVSQGTAIQIRIGHRQAKVNDKTIRLDSTPYIENGRTIVPISFIRDAMDVNVSYDPATGHLLIESKK